MDNSWHTQMEKFEKLHDHLEMVLLLAKIFKKSFLWNLLFHALVNYWFTLAAKISLKNNYNLNCILMLIIWFCKLDIIYTCLQPKKDSTRTHYPDSKPTKQIPISLSLVWPDQGSHPWSTTLEAGTLTITPLMRF
jgi:hypothetical protein